MCVRGAGEVRGAGRGAWGGRGVWEMFGPSTHTCMGTCALSMCVYGESMCERVCMCERVHVSMCEWACMCERVQVRACACVCTSRRGGWPGCGDRAIHCWVSPKCPLGRACAQSHREPQGRALSCPTAVLSAGPAAGQPSGAREQHIPSRPRALLGQLQPWVTRPRYSPFAHLLPRSFTLQKKTRMKSPRGQASQLGPHSPVLLLAPSSPSQSCHRSLL